MMAAAAAWSPTRWRPCRTTASTSSPCSPSSMTAATNHGDVVEPDAVASTTADTVAGGCGVAEPNGCGRATWRPRIELHSGPPRFPRHRLHHLSRGRRRRKRPRWWRIRFASSEMRLLLEMIRFRFRGFFL
nr:unnamed protein product [Digitaria exilis]